MNYKIECISSERSKLHRGIKSISNNNACDEGIQTVSSVPCDSSMQLWLSHRPTKQVLTVHKYFNKSLEVELYFYIAANLLLFAVELYPTPPPSTHTHTHTHTLPCCSLLLLLTTLVILSSYSALCCSLSLAPKHEMTPPPTHTRTNFHNLIQMHSPFLNFK